MIAFRRGRRMLRAMPGALLALGLACAAGQALGADTFPDHAIKLIVPVPPAGAADTSARAIGQFISARLGQQIIIDNRPGAGTTLGLRMAAHAPADGYTLTLVAVSGIAIATVSYNDLPDMRKDFVTVAGIVDAPHMLVASAALGVHSVPELVGLLAKNPNRYNYASQGTGSLSHLESAVFVDARHLQVQHIPYAGSSAAMPGLISGTTAMMMDSVASVLPQARAGKLIVLGTTARRRVPQFPDAPTMGELGVPGLVADNPFVILAPAGTPPERVKVLTDALAAALADPQVDKTLADAGLVPHFVAPADFAKIFDQEYGLWPGVARKLTGPAS
ncbi:MAG TPA: tripartite tricarboxylate transporter substrate binding protein [Bordetella sp.]